MSAFINLMACLCNVSNLDPDSRGLRSSSGPWFGNVIPIRIRNISVAVKKLSISDLYSFDTDPDPDPAF
jgi:hypothetical protein